MGRTRKMANEWTDKTERIPFTRGIPADAIYRNDQVTNILGRLRYASANKRFALLTGPSGTGKTTLLRCTKNALPASDYIVAYVSEQSLDPRMFYNRILYDFGCRDRQMQYANARLTLQKEIERLNGRKLVVMLDEAQTLSFEMLKELRFALNYKMDSENPFALILSGNDELWDKFKSAYFSSTLDRVDIECRLYPLTREETEGYIASQLSYAGMTDTSFTKAAVALIYKSSHGTASTINKICSQALRLASQRNANVIDDAAINDVLGSEVTTRFSS
ncbi:MAG: AAA family ATPase [Bacteroidales bacterium]|nr:AAA family ATPase [Bacteroidales bacterium]